MICRSSQCIRSDSATCPIFSFILEQSLLVMPAVVPPGRRCGGQAANHGAYHTWYSAALADVCADRHDPPVRPARSFSTGRHEPALTAASDHRHRVLHAQALDQVAPALADAEGVVIVEGFPAFDPARDGIAVYALKGTTQQTKSRHTGHK